MASRQRGSTLPKFGDWDEKNSAAAQGFTVIFDRARDNKKNAGISNNQPDQNQNQYQYQNQNQYQYQNIKHEPAKMNYNYPRKQKKWYERLCFC